MRRIGFVLGWLLLLAALVVLAWELVDLVQTGAYSAKSLGRVWSEIDRDSLLLLQPAIERHVSQWLWDEIVAPLTRAPAILVLGIPGLVLLLLCRRWR